MNSKSSTINPKIPGKLIFGFKKIRKVALIELRNGLSKIPDPSLLFHTRILGKKYIQMKFSGDDGRELKNWQMNMPILKFFFL